MEILGESPDGSDISMCGSFRVITALEFFEHPFSKLGHRDLLVTHTLAGHKELCERPPRVASAARAAQFKRRCRKSGPDQSTSKRHFSESPTSRPLADTP